MEAEFIDWLRKRLPPHPALRLGIGDDAALLALGQRGEAVVTVDLLTDGVDFRLQDTTPVAIGRKALAVNLSDLAAMAAEPVAAVVALALPKKGADLLAMGIYEGLLPLAEEFQLAIAGGDTNTWDGRLVLSVTAIGQPTDRGIVRRSGAVPGDALIATGEFGGSILGHHFDFTPRVSEALWINRHVEVHAAIDVSDGLTLDLARMATASGCGALLELDRIPIAPAAHELSKRDGISALGHALSDGEDFELLLAMPQSDADRLLASKGSATPCTQIGSFIEQPGLWWRNGDSLEPLAVKGWLHEQTR